MHKRSIQRNGIGYSNGVFARIKRWLYAGQRPGRIAKALNRVYALVGASGIMGNYVVALEVIGRKSGRVIVFPLVIAVVDGEQYLVSMLGDTAQWVQNVRAANGKAVLRSGGREEVQLIEIPADQRAPILQAYLQRADGARPHIPIDMDAPLAQFAKIAADYPVFHVTTGSHECPNMQTEDLP